MTGSAVDRSRELSDSVLDRSKDLSGSLLDRSRELGGSIVERAHDVGEGVLEPLKDLTGKGADRVRNVDVLGMVPDSVKDYAAEKTGRKRRRPRWVAALWVLGGLAGAAVVGMVVWKKLFSPKYDEEPFWDGQIDQRAEPVGEPHAYPAAGSGTGWPEPQQTSENTEAVRTSNRAQPFGEPVAGNGATATGAAPQVIADPVNDGTVWAGEGTGIAPPPDLDPALVESSAPEGAPARQSRPSAVTPATGIEPGPAAPAREGPSPQAVMAEGTLSQQAAETRRETPAERRESRASDPANRGMGNGAAAAPAAEATGRTASTPPTAPRETPGAGLDVDRTMDLPRTPVGAAGATPAAAAPPSEPAQRPEVPFTEQQAETNARLQLRQDELLQAFPNMTREDIVASDGNLDALAGMVAQGAGMTPDAARARIDAVLGTSPDKIGNPVVPPED